MLRRLNFALAAVATLLICTAPRADARPALRAEVIVSDELVRIGDLISAAGTHADIAVFRAPDVGQTGAVNTSAVLDAMRRHGLHNIDTRGLSEISVTRLGLHLSAKDIERRIAAALAASARIADAGNLEITFEREVREIYLDPRLGEPKILRASLDARSSRFDVILEVPGEGKARQRLRYTGIAVETVSVAVLTRSVGRSDTLRADDITIERRPKAAVPSGSLDRADDIVGMAPRRALSAAQTLRAADLMKPELVRQNEVVTILYQMPGINLTMRAKAVESGAEGDTIHVTNVQTKRTMQAVVTGLRQVTIQAAPTAASIERRPTGSVASATPPTTR